MRQIMSLPKEVEFLKNIEELSAMPSIALDIMALLNDPGSTMQIIVNKIKLDQAMISYIIKNCNSPLYGIRNEVTSITMAINLLGYTNLKSILMSYFMRNLYNLSGKNEIRKLMWKHSVSVAVFSRELGKKLKLSSEEAYLAGLLHDIGQMALYLWKPEEFEKEVTEALAQGKSVVDAELACFNVAHTDVGYHLMEKWNFSAVLKEVALYHHHPYKFEGSNQYIQVVDFANRLSHHYLEDRHENLESIWVYLKWTEKDLDALASEALRKIEDLLAIS